MFIQDSRRSYRTYTYTELILITDLCSFGTPVTYIYTELILITDLCSFGTPVGVTELILIQNLYLYKTYTYNRLMSIGTPVGVTELILILRSLHLFGGTHRYHREITERILVLRNLFLYGSTSKYYLFKCPQRRTLMLISNLSYTHTGVPVGTTEFILIRSLYGDTRRYYRD